MNHPTQEQFEAALESRSFVRVRPVPCICEGFNGFHTVRCAEAARTRSEPPAERRDCDEMPLGVPIG